MRAHENHLPSKVSGDQRGHAPPSAGRVVFYVVRILAVYAFPFGLAFLGANTFFTAFLNFPMSACSSFFRSWSAASWVARVIATHIF